MSEHRFKIGQAVEYYPPRSMYASRGVYHITAELPVRAGEFEYRIKHPREDHERIAAESDLNELWDAVAYRVDLQPAPGGVAPGGVLLDGVAIEFCGRPFFTAPSLKIRRVRLLELSKWRAQTTEKSYLHVQIVDGTLRLSSLGASLTRSFMFPTPIKQNPHLIVVRAIKSRH